MRRQMELETWTHELGFLIGLAAAVYLSPCRRATYSGGTESSGYGDRIATVEMTYLSVLCCRNLDNMSAVTREDTPSWWWV